jgi:dTDP-glucose 4,6-dehydratase
MARVLITGAAGFLGSHLCDRFIANGDEVLAMDNLITGNMENLEHLSGNPKFTFYHHDVSTLCARTGKIGLHPPFCFTCLSY